MADSVVIDGNLEAGAAQSVDVDAHAQLAGVDEISRQMSEIEPFDDYLDGLYGPMPEENSVEQEETPIEKIMSDLAHKLGLSADAPNFLEYLEEMVTKGGLAGEHPLMKALVIDHVGVGQAITKFKQDLRTFRDNVAKFAKDMRERIDAQEALLSSTSAEQHFEVAALAQEVRELKRQMAIMVEKDIVTSRVVDADVGRNKFPLDKFRGEGNKDSDWAQFEKRFECAAALNGWPKEAWPKIVSLHMDGKAWERFTSIEKEIEEKDGLFNWDVVKNRMGELYNSLEKEADALRVWNRLKPKSQGVGHILEYVRLFLQTYKDMGSLNKYTEVGAIEILVGRLPQQFQLGIAAIKAVEPEKLTTLDSTVKMVVGMAKNAARTEGVGNEMINVGASSSRQGTRQPTTRLNATRQGGCSVAVGP